MTATWTIFVREVTPTLRNPLGLLFTMAQPLVFLLLFGPLLTAVPGTGWQWFVPGILVMTGLFATAGAGWAVQTELMGGSMERVLVTPISRASILAGKTLKEVFALIAQAVVIVAVVLPFGFRLYPLTYLVEAERALFAGDFFAGSVLWAAVGAVATAAVGLAVGTRTLCHI